MKIFLRGAQAAAIVWACVTVHAQTSTQGAKDGPYTMPLAETKLCLETLGEAEAVPAHRGSAGDLQTVKKILAQAAAAVGGPDSRAAVPGSFAANVGAGPYVQPLTSTSVLVRWAAIQSEKNVRYGTNGQLTSTAPARRLPSPRWMHEAVLSGLAPGKEYAYSIRAGSADIGGTFRTSPAGDASFNFAVWGDSQYCFPGMFPGLAEQMAKQPLDLALCTGDAVEVGLADVDYYTELFRPARALLRQAFFFSAIGNHEMIGDPSLARHRKFLSGPNGDKPYFAFTHAHCRFIVLDSNDPGLFEGPQLEWLKQELSSDSCAKARFRFLFLHHAPFSWDWYGGEQKVQEVIVPLAEKSRVDVVFAGHFHCYDRGARTTGDHQTWYVVTGGGGGAFTENQGPGHHERDFMVKHAWKYHFLLAGVNDTGLSVRAIDDKGATFDEFAIPRPARAPATGQPARPASPTPAASGASAPPELAADDTRTCPLSSADRAAALAALANVRKALSGQSDIARRLELVAAVLEDARDTSREGVWVGPVERTARVARLLNGGVHYRLKPSERADASVQETLNKIVTKQLNGTFEVKGLDVPLEQKQGNTIVLRWILVDSITAK